MKTGYHALVKRLLDGELTLGELPPELRAEGEEELRLVRAADRAPLVPAGTSGVWTTTLALPVGQHQYAFVVDGARWVVDPAAPAVDDGFGRRNSVVAVIAQGAHTL